MVNDQLLGGNLSCDTGISRERLIEENKALREKIRKLQKQLETDYLTGLQNRKYVGRRVANADSSESGSLLFIDLDDFGKINKESGNHAGDAVLVSVAKLVIGMTREEDFVARWGGEEIIVWLGGMLIEQAVARAEQIRGALEKEVIIVDNQNISVTASIGVAHADSICDLPEVTTRADNAMRAAKGIGKNIVCFAKTYKKDCL